MKGVLCKRLTCRNCIRTTFYGFMCGEDVLKISATGKCESFVRDDKDTITDKVKGLIIGTTKEKRNVK